VALLTLLPEPTNVEILVFVEEKTEQK